MTLKKEITFERGFCGFGGRHKNHKNTKTTIQNNKKVATKTCGRHKTTKPQKPQKPQK
jgi:hypothetical protein